MQSRRLVLLGPSIGPAIGRDDWPNSGDHMPGFTESHVEEAALAWFAELGYTVLNGPDIAPDQLWSERATYADVVLIGRLRTALTSLNPTLPPEAIDDACRKLTH